MSSIFENMPKGSQKKAKNYGQNSLKGLKIFLLCGRIGGIRLREESLKDGR